LFEASLGEVRVEVLVGAELDLPVRQEGLGDIVERELHQIIDRLGVLVVQERALEGPVDVEDIDDLELGLAAAAAGGIVSAGRRSASRLAAPLSGLPPPSYRPRRTPEEGVDA
jgi:hypothetical protein